MQKETRSKPQTETHYDATCNRRRHCRDRRPEMNGIIGVLVFLYGFSAELKALCLKIPRKESKTRPV